MKAKKAKKAIEIFYVGKDFYWKSGTSMSSIYRADGQRSDWGDVQCLLEAGETVTIRPATDKEKLWAYECLADIEKRRSQRATA